MSRAAVKDRVARLRAADGDGPAIDYIGFSGLPDFAAMARAIDGTQPADAAWAGATYAMACRRAEIGDNDRVPASDAMLDQMEHLLDLSALRKESVPAVAGGVPCVPAYLAGAPLAMRVRRPVESPRGEICVFVNGFVSANVPANVVIRRGAAVLALVRALAMVRPVRLFSFALSGDSGRHAFLYSLPLDTAPVDLARAAWVLSAPEFTRQCRLTIQAAVLGRAIGLPVDFSPNRLLCDLHGVARDSAVFVAGLVTDGGAQSDFHKFKTDAGAVAWIQERVARLT